MKFSLQSRQVNCSDLLRLASQHEVGSLALETVTIEVRAWQVQGRVEHRVEAIEGCSIASALSRPLLGFAVSTDKSGQVATIIASSTLLCW